MIARANEGQTLCLQRRHVAMLRVCYCCMQHHHCQICRSLMLVRYGFVLRHLDMPILLGQQSRTMYNLLSQTRSHCDSCSPPHSRKTHPTGPKHHNSMPQSRNSSGTAQVQDTHYSPHPPHTCPHTPQAHSPIT